MRAFSMILLAVVLLVQAGVARAASIDFGASELRGNSVVVTDLGPGLLAIDPAFVSAAPIDLVVVLGSEEVGAPLFWNALVDNLTGEVWSAFRVEVFDGGSLSIRSISANAGAVAFVAATFASATIHFDPAEPAGIDLGAPFGVGEDWNVALGDGATSFRLRFAPVPVPEPSALLTMLFGLVALAGSRAHAR
jgi:hypothetical protein